MGHGRHRLIKPKADFTTKALRTQRKQLTTKHYLRQKANKKTGKTQIDKAKGRFHHEGSKDTKKSFNHQALFKPEGENISHRDHGAGTEEHGELKLKNLTNFRLTLREA